MLNFILIHTEKNKLMSYVWLRQMLEVECGLVLMERAAPFPPPGSKEKG